MAERMRPVMQEPAGLSANAAAAELNRRKIAGATGGEWVSDHCDPAARAAHMIGTARIGELIFGKYIQNDGGMGGTLEVRKNVDLLRDRWRSADRVTQLLRSRRD